MACIYRQWNLRMGAAQPFLGAVAELQDRLLMWVKPRCKGRRAGWEQKGECPWPFIPSSLRSTSRKRLRPGWAGSGWPLAMQQHFTVQNHPSFPFALVSHVPFVLPQGRTEELEESSQCTLPTVPLEGLHSPPGSPLPNAGGHCWRRTTTVLGVSQAWSKAVLLAVPALSQESLLGFGPSEAHQG